MLEISQSWFVYIAAVSMKVCQEFPKGPLSNWKPDIAFRRDITQSISWQEKDTCQFFSSYPNGKDSGKGMEAYELTNTGVGPTCLP